MSRSDAADLMPKDDQPLLICLTPMRNEAWVLDRFLKCASLWADHIVIADQNSDDGSREIALRYPKVTLVENNAKGYDEGERHRLVYEAARKIPGRHVLLAIDADEVVAANWMTDPQWATLRSLAPGTTIKFRWINLLPGFTEAWMPPHDIVMGFVDDGVTGHSAGQFHIPRLPMLAGAPLVVMERVKILHYQYTDWDRSQSKQRGYQCAEWIDNPSKRAIQLYRQFHQMNAIPAEQKFPLQPEWFEGYEQLGIDMKQVNRDSVYRWDREIIELFARHGTRKFAKLDIWNLDWNAAARAVGKNVNANEYRDPRTWFQRQVLEWLRKTESRAGDMRIRWAQRLLRLLGW